MLAGDVPPLRTHHRTTNTKNKKRLTTLSDSRMSSFASGSIHVVTNDAMLRRGLWSSWRRSVIAWYTTLDGMPYLGMWFLGSAYTS